VNGKWRRAAGELLRGLGGEPAVVLCGGSALLVLSHFQGSPTFFRQHLAWVGSGSGTALASVAGALPYFWWFGMSLLLYLVAPLALARATGGSFTRSYGMGLGDWPVGVRLAGTLLAVMLPVVWLASRTAAFRGQYPLAGPPAYQLWAGAKEARASVGLFAAYEAAYFAYFVGWEFFFRGWMLNGLLPAFGRAGAVLVPTVPFVLMHLGKPEPEALGAVVAGVALGVLALRTRSFWYGAVLHGVVAVWMDVVSAFPYLGRP